MHRAAVIPRSTGPQVGKKCLMAYQEVTIRRLQEDLGVTNVSWLGIFSRRTATRQACLCFRRQVGRPLEHEPCLLLGGCLLAYWPPQVRVKELAVKVKASVNACQ